jgi:hypothetical protein
VTLLARFRGAGVLRRIAAQIGVLALVLQLGMTAAHDPNGLGAFGALFVVPLCHAGGGSAPPLPSTPGKAASCPFCLALGASTALSPPSPEGGVVIAAFLPLPLPARADSARDADDPGSPAQPRAPPAFA